MELSPLDFRFVPSRVLFNVLYILNTGNFNFIAYGSAALNILFITERSASCHHLSASQSLTITHPGLLSLQERLNVDLQSADRVLELVLAQHSRVEDTEGTNDVILAADTKVDGGAVAGEVGGV